MVSPACPPVVGDDELQHVLVIRKGTVIHHDADDVPILPRLPFLQGDVPELQPLENPLPTRDLPRVPRVRIGMGDAQPIQPLGLARGPRDAALPCDQIEHPFRACHGIGLPERKRRPFPQAPEPNAGRPGQRPDVRAVHPKRNLDLRKIAHTPSPSRTVSVRSTGNDSSDTMSGKLNSTDRRSGKASCSSRSSREKLNRDCGSVRVTSTS